MSVSVVSSIEAMLAAFCSADRVTLTGSGTTPMRFSNRRLRR